MGNEFVSRILFSVVLAMLGAGFPNALCAQGYMMLNGGVGGAAHGPSAGIEAGKFFPRNNPRFLLGGDFSVAVNGHPGERLPGFQTDIRNEQQIGAVAGFRLVRNLYLVGTGGLSSRAEKDYFVANGKRIFITELKGKVYGSGSGQLRFVYKRFILGVGYHSRRGLVVGVGFTLSNLSSSRWARLRRR
jgi:hypothetical protein